MPTPQKIQNLNVFKALSFTPAKWPGLSNNDHSPTVLVFYHCNPGLVAVLAIARY